MKIEIPNGFFPPHGVPFETERQRDLAVALHNAGVIHVETLFHGMIGPSTWGKMHDYGGKDKPNHYRLAPPEPRKFGPFESSFETVTYNCPNLAADGKAMNAAFIDGIKRVRLHLTATAEEIL